MLWRKKKNWPAVKECMVLGIVNRKGGVGKTVTAVMVSSILAEHGYRVLLIDLDDSGDATMSVGGNRIKWQYCMADIFDGKCQITEAMVSVDIYNYEGCLWLIGSYQENQRYQRVNDPYINNKLKMEIGKIRDRFDFIVIDPPPTLSFWTIATLIAADCVIIPILTGAGEIKGYRDTVETIEVIKQINHGLRNLGAFITMPRTRTNVYREIKEAMKDILLETEIPQDVKIKEAQIMQVPLNIAFPKSKANQAYVELTKEVVRKCLEENR